MPRSPLTELYQKVNALVDQIHALPEDERNLLFDFLFPEPIAESKPKKKSGRKSASKASSKSARAQSLSGALSRTGKGRVQDDGDNEPQRQAITLCGASLASSGANCNLPEGHALHTDKGYVDYHPFRSAAPPARSRSSVNGGKGSTIPNSGTETEDVSNAHHAGG